MLFHGTIVVSIVVVSIAVVAVSIAVVVVCLEPGWHLYLSDSTATHHDTVDPHRRMQSLPLPNVTQQTLDACQQRRAVFASVLSVLVQERF